MIFSNEFIPIRFMDGWGYADVYYTREINYQMFFTILFLITIAFVCFGLLLGGKAKEDKSSS